MSALSIRAVPASALPIDSIEGWCARTDADLAEVMLDLAFDEVLLRHACAARSRPLPATLRDFLRGAEIRG